MMKFINALILIVVLFLHLVSNGQVPNASFSESPTKSFSDGLGKPNFNVSVGSQVGTSFNNNYWFTNYVMPSVNVDLTKRFTLVLGTGVAYTSFNQKGSTLYTDGTSIVPVNSVSLFAQASGIYKLNAKTNISGNILFEQITYEGQDMTKAKYNLSDFSVGIHYKPTSNVQFNAMFGVSSYPNQLSPINNAHFGNPINSAFNPMNSIW